MTNFLQQGILGDQSGQDNTEYVLMGLLAVVAGGIVYAILRSALQSGAQKVADGIAGF